MEAFETTQSYKQHGSGSTTPVRLASDREEAGKTAFADYNEIITGCKISI